MADFKGSPVVCIASGPSLTESDCWTVEKSGFNTIVINSSWERARFAQVLFAGDERWWVNNYEKVDIPAEKWTSCVSAQARYGLYFFRSGYRAWNSGLRSIELAEHLGASKIILLGFDCSVDEGKHWHLDHQNSSNPTFKVCLDWKKQFEFLSKRSRVPIINCSRKTALTCFPRALIENELC